MPSTTPLETPAFQVRVAIEFLKSLGVSRSVRETVPRLVELGRRYDIEQPPADEKDKVEFWEFAGLIADLAQTVNAALGNRRIRPELVGISSKEASKAIRQFASAVQARDEPAVQEVLDSAGNVFRDRARRPQSGEIRRIVTVIRGIPRKTRREIRRAESIPRVVFWAPVLGILLRVGLFFYRRHYTKPEFPFSPTKTDPAM